MKGGGGEEKAALCFADDGEGGGRGLTVEPWGGGEGRGLGVSSEKGFLLLGFSS